MDSKIVTCGQVKQLAESTCSCDLRGPAGFFPNFPIHLGAFQSPPDVDAKIAFMTWETREIPGKIQLHQSACVISNERYEELLQMRYDDAAKSLAEKEFLARSLVTP